MLTAILIFATFISGFILGAHIATKEHRDNNQHLRRIADTVENFKP